MFNAIVFNQQHKTQVTDQNPKLKLSGHVFAGNRSQDSFLIEAEFHDPMAFFFSWKIST